MAEYNRLQLGAGDVTRLTEEMAEVFLRPGWVHLGDKQKLSPRWEGRLTTWFWHPGDTLSYPDNHFDFIFSEHVLEHLNPPDAAKLLAECHRVMRPGAVIRTVVPDADLRPVPEPLDYLGAGSGLEWSSPKRHKARWNVYFLSWVLKVVGFLPVPLMYFDGDGNRLEIDPVDLYADGAAQRDLEMCRSLVCVRRMDSLVVDGIKIGEKG